MAKICPICAGKYSLRDVHDLWDDEIDNQLCEPHKRELDRLTELLK